MSATPRSARVATTSFQQRATGGLRPHGLAASFQPWRKFLSQWVWCFGSIRTTNFMLGGCRRKKTHSRTKSVVQFLREQFTWSATVPWKGINWCASKLNTRLEK